MEIRVDSEVVRLLTILDPHVCPVGPESRLDDYWDSCKKSFAQILGFSIKNKVSAVVVGGDMFHRKSPAKNPVWFLRELIRVLREFEDNGIPVIGIAGNHDLVWGSITSLERQPIGILQAAGVYHLLDEDPVVLKGNGFEVRVVGRSYGVDAVSALLQEKKGAEDYLVGVGHFWYGPKSGDFYGEKVWGPDELEKSEIDVFVIGHHHADQGIQLVNEKYYVVHGSMSQTGVHAHDITRKPSVGLVEFIKEKVARVAVVRLKVSPVEQIFDLEKQKKVVEEKRILDDFLKNLASDFKIGSWGEYYRDNKCNYC